MNWKDLHIELQDIMKQELNALRSCLTLLTELEQAYILQKRGPAGQDIESIKREIIQLRKKREKKTKELTGFSECDVEGKVLENAIKEDIDNSSETLTLWSQIVSLIEKIGEYEQRLQSVEIERGVPQKEEQKTTRRKKLDIL